MQHTADFLASLEVDAVKIHMLYVVKGTGMEQLYKEGGYTPLCRDEFIEAVCDFLERLPQKTVIERLTGDPHPQELVAPSWALGGKAQLLADIRGRMIERKTWQSRLFGQKS
jgi:radical SAM superfamily enzyme